MKIVVVASSIIPGNSLGIEHFTYRLLNSLIDLFPTDEFYVLIPVGTRNQWTRRLSPRPNLFFKPIPFSPRAFDSDGFTRTSFFSTLYDGLKRLNMARVAFRCIRRLNLEYVLNKIQPDIVYSSFHLEILSDSRWKTVITVHDLREVMTEFYDAEKASLLCRNVETAKAVIVAWKHPFDQLREMFPKARDKSYLIPFPIPISPNSANPEAQTNQEILLFASALRPQKNHINLIRALRKVVDERQKIGKSTLLICAGTTHSPMYETLLQEIHNLRLADHVRFTGFISDEALKGLYAQAHLVVTPTLWEAASGAVFESFLFEKPVACSRISPIVSQVEQSGGFVNYFNPDDPQDISCSILAVLENPAPYIDGAKRGALFVRALNWEKTAKSYMDVFSHVAQSE